MKIYYTLNKTANNKNYLSFGISARNEKNEIIKEINDISIDETKMKRLIANCNKLKLSIVHINDIIEDFLNQ